MKNNITIEQAVRKIAAIIDEMTKTKGIYFKAKLASLKNTIILTDKNKRDAVCYEILSHDIFDVFQMYIEKEPNNEFIIINSGEMLLILFSTISNGSKQIKCKWKEYNQNNKCLNQISSILLNLSKDKQLEIQIFLKVYLRIVEWEMQSVKEAIDFSFHLQLINKLLDNHKENDAVVTFLLEVTFELVNNKGLKDYYSLEGKQLNNDCGDLIKLLLLISTKVSKSEKEIVKAIQCLNSLMVVPSNIEIVRNEPFIVPLSLLLQKYFNHLILPIQLRSLLFQIINVDDLFILLEVIKAKENKEVYIEDLDYKITKEIKDELLTNTQEAFHKFKKCVLEIILLLLKEKQVLFILRDLNSLESLVHTFKSFSLAGEKDNKTYLEIMVKIIIWLGKIYDEENVPGVELSSSLQRNILYLSMKWIMYIDDDKIVQEIMAFFFKKSKNNFKELISDNTQKQDIFEAGKVFFPVILNRFYMDNWMFDFLYNLPISAVYYIDGIDFDTVCNELTNDIRSINNISNAIIPELLSKIEYTMNSLTLKLILGIRIQSEDQKFLLTSTKALFKVFELIIGLNKSVFEKSHTINQILSFMFSSLENNSSLDEKEKSNYLLQFINKLTLRRQINGDIIHYLTIKLYQISSMSNSSLINTLFSSEIIVVFEIVCLSYPNISPQLAKGIMNILLLTLTTSVQNKMFITQLFCQNGLLKLVKIGSDPFNSSIEMNKTFAEILQSIKTKYIEQLFDFCSDNIFIQEYIWLIKQINFSNNSLNEYCYLQILEIFFISVSNQEFSKEIIETTQLVDYLVKEATDVYNFYTNTTHSLLVVLIQILAVIFNSVGEMMVIITPNLFKLINLILNQMIIEKQHHLFDLDNFTNLMKILVKINAKETEYIYPKESYKEIIKIILVVVYEDNVQLKENCVNLCLTLIEKWLKIEDEIFSKANDLFTIAYFKELVLKFPRSSKTIKSRMDNIALLIEKDKIRRHDIIEEYSEIEKSLASMNSKKRVNPVVARGKRTIKSSFDERISEEITDQYINQRRRTSVNISNNPTLQRYYDVIVSSLRSLLTTISDKKRKEERIENECEQISKLIQILKIFARDRENCQKVYGKELMNILIDILNIQSVYLFPNNEVYLLLNKVVEQIEGNDEKINFDELFYNESAFNYFIKEIMSIKDNYDIEVSDLVYNKTLFISNIIAKVSSKQNILQKNKEFLNVKELMIILKNISNDHFIILNLMNVFNNIISLNHQDSLEYIRANLEDFCKLMLETLWNVHKMDFRVIELILKMIENIKEEEGIIKEMLKHYAFKTKINELLVEKCDATLMIILFNLLNSLMIHRYFADSVLDYTGVENIINASKVYKSYKSIIEKALSIFTLAIKFPNGGFIESLGKYGLNKFCMFLFVSFMNTCNDDIIKTIIAIIHLQMSDNHNKNELSSRRNVETIQNLFFKNIDNESMIIDISSILFNQITINDKKSNPNMFTVIETNVKNLKNDSDIEILNYDLDLMMVIVEKALMRYNTNLPILKEITKIIRTLFKQTNDTINKLRFINCFLFFFGSYLELALVDSLELLINEINELIEDSEMPCLNNTINNIISSIYQMLKTKSCHNKQIYNISIEIMMKITKNNDSATLIELPNLFPTLCLFKNNEQYHDDLALLNFSFILLYLFKSNPSEIPVDYLIFILSYVDKMPPVKKIDFCYLQMLENTKGVADNYLIKEEKEGKQAVDLLLSLFKTNIDNDNNIERIIMIIRKLLLHSHEFKEKLNFPELDFVNIINSFVKSIKGQNKTFLEYQGMSISCMLSSKAEETNQSFSQMNTMEMKMSEQEINPEMKQFLSVSHLGKYYSEIGEIKSVLLKMDNKLTYIQAIDKGMPVDSMQVLDMESCVRSCSTPAFEKSKNIKNLFIKKPNAKKCFTIFAVKTLSGQITFNVQCETEDDCIKYVDYLSTLINNRKTSSK